MIQNVAYLKRFNIKSDDKVFLEIEDGEVTNPYDLLPDLFEDYTNEQLEDLWTDLDSVKNGGAALTAYSKLQFTQMPDDEKERTYAGLLRYCELDTLAMVMLYEFLREKIS